MGASWAICALIARDARELTMQQLPPTDPQAIIARDYRRKLSLQMRAIGPEDITKRIPPGPCRAQRKYDGVFSVFFHKQGEKPVLVDAAGRCRDESDVPFLGKINLDGIDSLQAACELWCDNGEQRERVRYVLSAEAKHKYFCAFDVLSGPPRCIPEVETHSIDRDEVPELFRIMVQTGAEGLVVRDCQGGIWKIKPVHTIDACILGYAEGAPGEVRDVLLGVWRDAVTVQRLCSCGTGFDRKALYKQLLPLVTASDYTETNSEHAPYRMVLPRVAVELAFTDLCTDNAAGELVKRPVLEAMPLVPSRSARRSRTWSARRPATPLPR